MHIDWFVLVAQIFNFLILVGLLKYFLYGRIIKAIDERKARIADEKQETERLKSLAQCALSEYEDKRKFIEDQSRALLENAQEKAEAEKTRLAENARKEIDDLKESWKSTLSSEKKAFLNNLKSRAGGQVQETVRRVLTDLAGISLEERIVLSFMERIKNADAEILEMLSGADEETGVTVRTSFEVGPDLEGRLVRYLKTLVPQNTPLIHESVKDEISGIELISSGKKISWSIGDYLDDLKDRFNQALREDIPDAPEVAGS